MNRRYLIDVDGMDPKKAVERKCWLLHVCTRSCCPTQSKQSFVLSVQLVSGPQHWEEELSGWPAARAKEEVTLPNLLQAWVWMFLPQVEPGWSFDFLLTNGMEYKYILLNIPVDMRILMFIKNSNEGMDNVEVEPVRGCATDRHSEAWSQTHSLHADSRSHR